MSSILTKSQMQRLTSILERESSMSSLSEPDCNQSELHKYFKFTMEEYLDELRDQDLLYEGYEFEIGPHD